VKTWQKTALILAVGFIGLAALIAATPVTPNKTNERVVWNGPKATPDTLLIPTLGRNASTDIDYILVTNTSGGTAGFANVAIQRVNIAYSDTTQDTMIVWQGKAVSATASPSFGVMLAPGSGLYKSNEGDTIRVIVTMASANSLYVACKYHEGR
jgi:hypothetical protein